ncbi:MAG: DUF1223 domain-containing protein [Gammaproteobacteria bacterium]
MDVGTAGKIGRVLPLLLILGWAGARTAQAAQPVLVELFTSEGCSSCPPADALLRRLIASQPIAGVQIIGLEEHVDYWNGLGWADPFSSRQFTRRQYQFASALHESAAYTPQMVVDGRVGFVGSDAKRALSAIASARDIQFATISLTRAYIKPGEVRMRIEMKRLPPSASDSLAGIWLAVTEDHLASQITAGENNGRRLVHDAVVRRLELIGRIAINTGTSFTAAPVIAIAPGWRKDNLNAVVFVQGATSRHILGVASVTLGPSKSSDPSRGVE